MRRSIAALALAAVALPALAQSPADTQRWNAAQSRYQQETDRFYAERDRFYAERGRRGGYYSGGGYDAPPPPPSPGDDRYDPTYDASRFYREGQYQERTLAENDRVYAGSDGRYYCKRSDGTTGLIAGAAGGGILGNVIDGGHSRTAGTLIGAAIGALAGKSIEQNSQQNIRCR